MLGKVLNGIDIVIVSQIQLYNMKMAFLFSKVPILHLFFMNVLVNKFTDRKAYGKNTF